MGTRVTPPLLLPQGAHGLLGKSASSKGHWQQVVGEPREVMQGRESALGSGIWDLVLERAWFAEPRSGHFSWSFEGRGGICQRRRGRAVGMPGRLGKDRAELWHAVPGSLFISAVHASLPLQVSSLSGVWSVFLPWKQYSWKVSPPPPFPLLESPQHRRVACRTPRPSPPSAL